MATMRIEYLLLGFIFVLSPVWGDPISVEQFESLSLSQQKDEISHVPPEMRAEFEKLYEHDELVSKFDGESNFRFQKEKRIAKARGFTCLESVFDLQIQVWYGYFVFATGLEDQAKLPTEQRQKIDSLKKRMSDAHSLIYNLAPSPAATQLEKDAEMLIQSLMQTKNGIELPKTPTVKERAYLDNQVDNIYTTLQSLPKLTPLQAKKEYDAFTDKQFLQTDGQTGAGGAGSM